ncbi:diguanylate cyclase domain-containing protein [Ruminococcus gauvreauii]|uniref:Diguanylate cyclase n=1 Tax=Ruminococcus gauvreauii TaxID=438033 RepID=A0ABY5VGE1_9FIRM|nr:diguanylate cyclase [Ruminococcus gauvreauii]UWP59635.1 diguanylate cyclase [Ruminococcus gauvreauii]
MSEIQSEFCKKAVEKVRDLWHLYIINHEPDQMERGLYGLPGNLLMIGTGRHEFYKNREEFLRGITADQLEARNIQFELQDEWYEAQEITGDVCVVYGSIWVREKSAPGKAVLVDMEGSRFTVVCRDTADGVQICSLHHSMPYLEQGEDEYYPQTLVSLANEAIQRSKALEQRVELDHMTGLYSRVYLEHHVRQKLIKEAGYFFSVDLDDFKSVNDSMGHLAGDKVIREFSQLLKKIFGTSAIIGRMGGDEFAVWDSTLREKSMAGMRFLALTEGCRVLSGRLDIPVSCSAGIAFSGGNGEDFTDLYLRTDKAMYIAKERGKGRYCWAWSE